MLKHLFICALLIGFAQPSLNAQSIVLQGARLINESGDIRIAGLNVLGVKNSPQGLALFYRFTHPNGGIQQVRGSLMSGGADPVSLSALGAAILGPDQAPTTTHVLRWWAEQGASTRGNFVPDPLTSAQAHAKKPLANAGEVMSYDTLRVAIAGLRPSDSLFLRAIDPDEPRPFTGTYAAEYYKSSITVGLSGGLSGFVTTTHTLKPASERTGLLATPYRTNTVNHGKESMAGAFESENMSFKVSAGAPVASDPVSGNITVFGALKYRKDSSKENSEYFEFKFLTFTKEGQLLANERYVSPEPLGISGYYPLYGPELAPDVREITKIVYIMQGEGAKDMSNVNPKLVRALILDIKTGKLVAQDDDAFNQEGGRIVQSRRLPDGKMELTYLYDQPNAQKGVSIMVVGPEGIVSIADYFGSSSMGEPLALKPAPPASASSMRTLQRIPMSDGGEAALHMIAAGKYSPETRTTTYQPLGYALSVYEPNGYLRAFIPLNLDQASAEGQNKLIYAAPDRLIFMVQEAIPGLNRASFMEINLNTYAVRMVKLPDGYTMPGTDSIYLNREQKMFYLFAQPTAGKGLYLFHYPL